MMRKIQLLLAVLLISLLGHAQSAIHLPSESIVLHTNTDFLLTGETLFFKLYCQNNNTGQFTLSKIAYVEVIDRDGKAVLQAKVGLSQGEGSGDFFLSSRLESDHYTIIAYTQWMRNFDQQGFFRKEITIINPFRIQTNSNFKVQPSATSGIPITDSTTQVAGIKTDKPAYPTRSKVFVAVQSSDDLIGQLTMSVHLTFDEAKALPVHQGSKFEDANNSGKFLPEIRGKIISGIATSSDGTAFAGKLIFLSLPGKDYYFSAARTDMEGRFHFITELLSLSKTLIIQAERAGDSKPKISLEMDFISDHSTFIPSPFVFDPELQSHLKNRSLFSQIENSYYERKKDSVNTKYPGRFYNTPDKVYLLDAYTRFPTMEDIFREYVVEVIVKKRGETFELKVMDGKNRLPFSGDPFILLDGVLVMDNQTVMNYDPQLLKKIEIVTKRYFLGPATMSGIVSLETYEGDTRKFFIPDENKFTYEGLQPSKILYAPNYLKEGDKLDRIPDYRVQLSWVPSIRLVDGKSEITFYTSDVAGQYEIVVQGISKTKGAFKSTQRFKVLP